ncbi:MAG: hypothetical protein NZM06_10565 [Chloroherpetonaceae bacterium]|nr:hypothetical protein [Chloroherpetonaceae bacterium]MDW8437085.1 hypothetical protein [Chloroherpetonaceae bacterium]
MPLLSLATLVAMTLQAQPSDFGYSYWSGGLTLANQTQPYARGNYASQSGAFYGATLDAGYLFDMKDVGVNLGDKRSLGVAYSGSLRFGWGGAEKTEKDADIHLSNALGVGFLTATPFRNVVFGLKALVPLELDARLPASGLFIKPTLEVGDYYFEFGYLMPFVSNPHSPQYGVSVAEATAIKKFDDYFGVGLRCEVRKAAQSEQAMRLSLVAMF